MTICPSDIDLFFDDELVGPPKPTIAFRPVAERLRYEGCDGFYANGDPMYVYVPYTEIKCERFLVEHFFPTDEDDVLL